MIQHQILIVCDMWMDKLFIQDGKIVEFIQDVEIVEFIQDGKIVEFIQDVEIVEFIQDGKIVEFIQDVEIVDFRPRQR